MTNWKQVNIPLELYEVADEYITKYPVLGYKSVPELLRSGLRLLIKSEQTLVDSARDESRIYDLLKEEVCVINSKEIETILEWKKDYLALRHENASDTAVEEKLLKYLEKK